jgi:hypothetical protein
MVSEMMEGRLGTGFSRRIRVKTVPSDSRIPSSPVTTSNNSFSVLTIEEPGVEEDTVEMEGEGARTPSEVEKSEGAISPSDSKRRGKKP